MASVEWDKLKVGDFFSANINMGEDTLLYQKIQPTNTGYNATLLNNGELCYLYTDNQTFEKVEVTFSIKPTE
jgi:hypothetical protein